MPVANLTIGAPDSFAQLFDASDGLLLDVIHQWRPATELA